MNNISYDIEEFKKRLYFILMTTASIANTVGFISNAMIFGFTLPTAICAICAIIVYSLFIIGIISKHFSQMIYILLALIVLFEFPFLYYVYGASTISYMLLGLLGIIVFIEKRRKLFLL